MEQLDHSRPSLSLWSFSGFNLSISETEATSFQESFGGVDVMEPSLSDTSEDTKVYPEPVPAKDEVDDSESEDGDAIVARQSVRNANGLVQHGLEPVWTAWGGLSWRNPGRHQRVPR